VIDIYRNDPTSCFVAEMEGRLVGFLLGTIIDKRNSPRKYGYLVWLGVHDELKGKGIGKRLFFAYRKKMEEEGVRRLLVDTDPRNEEAVGFFTRCGFTSPQDHVYLSLKLVDDQ
jgi:ribosomal protein S18 acetylase RimI-like enzyme